MWSIAAPRSTRVAGSRTPVVRRHNVRQPGSGRRCSCRSDEVSPPARVGRSGCGDRTNPAIGQHQRTALPSTTSASRRRRRSRSPPPRVALGIGLVVRDVRAPGHLAVVEGHLLRGVGALSDGLSDVGATAFVVTKLTGPQQWPGYCGVGLLVARSAGERSGIARDGGWSWPSDLMW